MNPIVIGWDARGKRMELDGDERLSTHMHVIGGSGTGKSKFLEWMVRRDVREGHGLCVIDWHGTLYNDLIRYFAYQDVGAYDDDRAVVILNPSQPDFISGFNPFARTGGDLSVQVNRRVDATIRPWGVTDTNLTPTFARICRVLYTFMVENGETLPNAAALLHFKNDRLRDYAAAHVSDGVILAEWQELQSITRREQWRDEVLSTKNRLLRFVGSQGEPMVRGVAGPGLPPRQIARHRSFGDREAELDHLAVDSRSAPCRILARHSPHDLEHVAVDLPSAAARAQSPEEPESRAMPADDSLGPNHNERVAPSRPETLQRNPEQAIRVIQSRSRAFALEHGDLLAQG
jgi:hypothetical protein